MLGWYKQTNKCCTKLKHHKWQQWWVFFTENGLNTFECSHAFAVSVRKAVKENQDNYTVFINYYDGAKTKKKQDGQANCFQC